MNLITNLLFAPEFWMAISLFASILPGPQTRILPGLFKAIAAAISARAANKS